jgi:hypothetical protein
MRELAPPARMQAATPFRAEDVSAGMEDILVRIGECHMPAAAPSLQPPRVPFGFKGGDFPNHRRNAEDEERF